MVQYLLSFIQNQIQNALSILDFLCPTMFQCGHWPAGNYSFEIHVNGLSYVSPPYNFMERKVLKILAVPIITKFNGQVLEPPDDSWKTSDEFMYKVYPVGFTDIEWIQGPTLTATDHDMNNIYDKNLLLLDLALLDPRNCGPDSNSACYDDIVGFIPDICQKNSNCQTGWTNPLYMVPHVVMTTKSVEMIVAHEIGHHYGLGDEYQGGEFYCDINPAPKEYQDRNGHKCSDLQAIPWNESAGSKVVGIGEEQDYPYDVIGIGDLGDMLSFMGSSGGKTGIYWITPDSYHQVFTELIPGNQILSTNSMTETIVQASGWIGLDGTVQLDPWISLPATPPVPITGTYTILALDAADQVLASQGFEVSFLLLSDPPEDLDIAPFQVSLPFPAGTAAFQIKKGSEVLHRIDVSDNSPIVNVISPNGGENWGSIGEGTITWNGSDADGDMLYYTVLYTPNGTDWVIISTNITATQTTIALEEIPGGVGAKIQVIATDGINTSLDELDGSFTVGKKGPSAYILSPSPNTVIPNGTSFYLNGYAYDREDGSLADGAFQWYSNKDGYLGEGKLILVNLFFGDQIITLTSVDSDGNTDTDIIYLFIGNRVFLPISLRN